MNSALKVDQLSASELTDASASLQLAVIKLGAFLTDRCNGDYERCRLEIRRALDLPPPVLVRRAKSGEAKVNADKLPTIPEQAAIIARMIATVRVIGEAIERKHLGASLQ
jgi:hypothetical protein